MNRLIIFLLIVFTTLSSEAHAASLVSVTNLPPEVTVTLYVPDGWDAAQFQNILILQDAPKTAAIAAMRNKNGNNKVELFYMKKEKSTDVLQTFISIRERLPTVTLVKKYVSKGDENEGVYWAVYKGHDNVRNIDLALMEQIVNYGSYAISLLAIADDSDSVKEGVNAIEKSSVKINLNSEHQ